jgi:3',5'-nucleoside bisphosphate phosphatase
MFARAEQRRLMERGRAKLIMKVDLHLHTTASDGTWTNEILLQRIIEHNIKVFSITDHNSVENTLKMIDMCIDNGIVFIPGVELSCYHKQNEYHITAYGFDPGSSSLQRLLASNQQAMDQWFNIVVKHAAEATGQFSMDQYREYQNDSTRGGCKAINFFLDAGVITSWEGFFEHALSCGVKPSLPEAREVIEVVKCANGRPILAHPSVYHKGALMKKEVLAEWIDLGIMGLECFHPSTENKPDSVFYVDFCNRNNLMITGGSDCHGEFGHPRFIGKPEVTIDMIRVDFI